MCGKCFVMFSLAGARMHGTPVFHSVNFKPADSFARTSVALSSVPYAKEVS